MSILRTNFILFLPLLILVSLTNLSLKVTSQNTSSYRLPTAIQPIKYNLHITSGIHDNNLVFSGHVVIELVVKESTNEIVLHAKELRDLVISVIDVRKNRRYEDLKYSLQKDKDFLTISAPKRLNAGERYRLEILYLGNIQEKNFYGIYKTTYLDEFYNQSIPLAVTQFEPIGARLAFPCFDEPIFRAKFAITITHGSYYSALSNMPINGLPGWNGNMITTIFRETPAMPTYLVGFVICNYNFISEFVNNIEHRVFYPPNSKDSGERAMANAIGTVAFLEKYLGIDYYLPKLDHIHVKDVDAVGIPWGLGIYNDNEFLQTLESRDETVKRIVTQNSLISQQWFTNLVPPKWWSHAWVNAALGTYYGYEITHLTYPTWRMEEFFILEEMKVLMKENMEYSLFREVQTEAEISNITSDDLSYRMGVGVIKMFHHAIGNETFIKGLQMFLNKYKNSNTDEDDFYRALQSAIHEDYVYLFQNDQSLAEIMKSWTHNPGIPVVKITRNYKNRTITLQQKPKSPKNINSRWWIPLNFATASNTNFGKTTTDYIIPPVPEVNFNLEEINVSLLDKDWLILNKQQTGLYHVIYDDKNLDLIADALNRDHTSIHHLNRALLFRDLRFILDTELDSIYPVLNALKYLKSEQESMPWFEATALITDIRLRLEGSKSQAMFKNFVRDIITDFYRYFFELPFYKLTFADSIVKKSIFQLACNVEVNECLALARHQYKEYLLFKWPMEESLKMFTICKALQSASMEELEQLMEKILSNSLSNDDETDFLLTMKCIKSKEHIKLISELADENEKKKDFSFTATRIKTFIRILHLPNTNLTYEWTKSDGSLQEIKLKREMFQNKHEDFIFNWLKVYETKKASTINTDIWRNF